MVYLTQGSVKKIKLVRLSQEKNSYTSPPVFAYELLRLVVATYHSESLFRQLQSFDLIWLNFSFNTLYRLYHHK